MSTRKKVLITFFDSKSLMYRMFLPRGKTINSAWCMEFLGKFLDWLCCTSPEHHLCRNAKAVICVCQGQGYNECCIHEHCRAWCNSPFSYL